MSLTGNVEQPTVRIIPIVLSLLICVSFYPGEANSGPFSVARMVNDVPITNYELDQRKRLLQALGAPTTGLDELAMTQLTEDRLKQQAAQLIGMTLQEDALDEAVDNFAKQRQTTAKALRDLTQSAGVAPESFDDFVRTGVMWRDLVNIRFRSRATPSEADLENILNYAASAQQESFFIREIAIPFAERGLEGAKQLANRIIRDVRNGASFAQMARQYSRTSTATNGGAVGWTPANRLPPLFAGQLLSLSPGEITAPIEVPAGIVIVQLADIRQEPIATKSSMTVSYTRLDVVKSEGKTLDDLTGQALQLADEVEGCDDTEGRFKDFGPASGRYGPDPLAAVPANIALALAALDAGESTILPPTDAGVSVITLCARAATDDPEAIENLERQVFNQRMNNYASSYLQELQADAIIVDK